MKINKNVFPCEVKCVAIESHNSEVKTFYLSNKKCFEFEAGQFVNLLFDIDGQKHLRSYTISSAATNPFVISVTVKKEGLVSQWLFNKFKVGDKLTIKNIDGQFTLPAKKEPIAFISGGVGITPALSMLQTIYSLKSDYPFLLIHFDSKTLFNLKSTKHQKIIFINPKEEGYFSGHLLKKLGVDLTKYNVFCCGPDKLYEPVYSFTQSLNISDGQFFYENFSIINKEDAEEQFNILCDNLSLNIKCTNNQSVLESFTQHQVSLPYGCCTGVCGACMMKLIKGTINMKDNGGIREDEKQEGYFLPCCSTPKSNLEVEVL